MRCALAVSLLCLFLGLSLAQAEPLASSISSPDSPSAPSPGPSETWSSLDSIWDQLELEGIALSETSLRLQTELLDARERLTKLSTMLESSQIQAQKLSSSLAQAEASLLRSEESLKKAMKSRDLELWLWRGGAAVGIVATGLAIIWGATR
jgi:hypothetical protein